MPSATAKAKRKQQRAQLQQNAQRVQSSARTDQQWIEEGMTEIQRLAEQLEHKRQIMAQAQQMVQTQHGFTDTTQTAQAAQGMAQATSHSPTGATGTPQNDSKRAGPTRKATRKPRTNKTQGISQNDSGTTAGRARQAAHQPKHTSRSAGRQQQQQQQQPLTSRPYNRSSTVRQPESKTYTKAMTELLQVLDLEKPPVEPAANKLFIDQVLTKVKRIFKSQKQRETRRMKSRYYSKNK